MNLFPSHHRASILLWVLVFSGILVTTFFYFALKVKSTFQNQTNMLDFVQKKEMLRSVVQLNIDPTRIQFQRGDMKGSIEQYQDEAQGELSGYDFTEYRFTAEEDMSGVNEITLIWNLCTLDINTDEDPETATILLSVAEWEKEATVMEADITQSLFEPNGNCDDGKTWRDKSPLPAFDFKNNNYLIFLSAINQPAHYKLTAVSADNSPAKLPDRFYHIEAQMALLNGERISEEERREAYKGGEYENFGYGEYIFSIQ